MTLPPHLAAACRRYLPPAGAIAGGLIYAASLPPWNWGLAVLLSLLPLYGVAATEYKWKYRFLCGWLWGMAWAGFAFRFLREIHWCIPWALMPVIALWGAVFTALLGWFGDRIRKKNLPAPREELLFAFTAAALFTLVEWTRYRLFVWNDFSVTMWRCPAAMQIARFTGRYGVTFLLALGSAGIFALRRKKAGLPAAGCAAGLWAVSLLYGTVCMNSKTVYRDPVTLRAALVQGNLPQLRRASDTETLMAITTYTALTRKVLEQKPDLVLWPECAVPVPLRANMSSAARYRRELGALLTGTPMVIGTLDFSSDSSQLTNSALLVKYSTLEFEDKYDKFHRVPFGEYVPGRKYLPESLVKAFDMGRDLAPGENLLPLQLSDDISIGCAICYEGVFSYVTGGFAANGANVLAALSNDVWYPESSEPEQHLANAVMRCVETNLPMIRCGNNGGSGVVTAKGEFTGYIGSDSLRPELLREQAAGIVTVTLERNPDRTLFVRYGNWWLFIPAALLLAEILLFIPRKRRK
ncbi:MAG: apolipoprotein N-acyltransferase [Lentisphaerae bacterium]|nr:apolipoprotein N-acyltransferase [Lentisphaerota bacterium]